MAWCAGISSRSARCCRRPAASSRAARSTRGWPWPSTGFLRGMWLTVKRIGRCHPFHPGGYDPPPPRLPNTQPTRELMEKRVVLAAMLMAGLLMVYQTLFLSPPAETPQPPKTETQAKTPTSPAPPSPRAAAQAPRRPPGTPSPAAAVPAASAATPAPAVPEHIASVESPLYRAKVISRGGDLQEWELIYRGQKPLVMPGLLGPHRPHRRAAGRARPDRGLHALRGPPRAHAGKARRRAAARGRGRVRAPHQRDAALPRRQLHRRAGDPRREPQRDGAERRPVARLADARGMAQGQDGAVPGPAPDPRRGALAGGAAARGSRRGDDPRRRRHLDRARERVVSVRAHPQEPGLQAGRGQGQRHRPGGRPRDLAQARSPASPGKARC